MDVEMDEDNSVNNSSNNNVSSDTDSDDVPLAQLPVAASVSFQTGQTVVVKYCGKCIVKHCRSDHGSA